MNAQQLHDYIIKPALEYMGGNYNSKNARFLLLCTAAIESQCGEYIKQINGPALGIFQMEPATHEDIWRNCDVIQSDFGEVISALGVTRTKNDPDKDLIISPVYACAMARLKYSMDSAPLPDHNDIKAVYAYYKRIYNTEFGASTYDKFISALNSNNINDVVL